MTRYRPVALVALLLAAPALAGDPPQPSSPPTADPEMKASCEAMMAKMAAVQEEEEERRAELEEKLDRLMAAMKSAKGKDKADAVALVVEELVARCRAMAKESGLGHECCTMGGSGCGMPTMARGCGAGCTHHGQGATGAMGHDCGMKGSAPSEQTGD